LIEAKVIEGNGQIGFPGSAQLSAFSSQPKKQAISDQLSAVNQKLIGDYIEKAEH
jgi:hypothetical protein